MGIKSSLVIPAVVAMGGNGGGSSDTTTFITNKIGNTVDVSGLGTIKNVYKNGALLQPGISITGYKFSGGYGGKWISLSDTYMNDAAHDLNTANSWYYEAKFTLPDISSDLGEQASFFAYSGLTDCQGPSLKFKTNGVLMELLSSGGNSWDISNGDMNYQMQYTSRASYFMRFGYSSLLGYYFRISDRRTELSNFYSLVWVKQNVTKSFFGTPLQLLNLGDDSYGQNWNGSTVYMPTVKIVADNYTLFDGAISTLGTDYINHNCSQATYDTCTNDYAINGATLILNEDLISTDTLAIVH